MIFILIGLIVLIIILLYLLACTYLVYRLNKAVFLVHGSDPDNPCFIRYEDYPSLKRINYSTYYYNKKINGYIYYKEKGTYKGFIILSHGLFGTHVQYLKDINFLTDNGYKVLAYDQYGCGISQGDKQEYLAHGIYVCENVINDVIHRNINTNLDLILYGHSWGAYSVTGAIKNYPQIKKVIARSGPVSPRISGRDLFKVYNKHIYRFIYLGYNLAYLFLIPHMFRIKATRGLKKNKTTKILFIHAKDDNIVFYNHSLANYYLKKKQSNIEFYTTDIGKHNSIITLDGLNNYSELVKKYNSIKKESELAIQNDLLTKFNLKLKKRDSLYPINEEVANKIIEFLNKNT